MSCPDCAAAFDQGWSAVEERYADLLAAVEGVIADVIVTKDNGDRMCIVCMAYFDADAREPQAHVTYCPIPALTAAIKKATGQL